MGILWTVMLEPQVGEAATSAVGGCWSSALLLQPGYCTHICTNSLLLGNALSEKCRATQMVEENAITCFLCIDAKYPLLLCSWAIALLISHWFYSRNEFSRQGFTEEKVCLAGGGVGEADIKDDIKKCKADVSINVWCVLAQVNGNEHLLHLYKPGKK